MNAIPYDRPEEEWDSYEDEQESALPGRPRRKVLSWWSAGLFALILAGVGFYAGVRVEKNQLPSSTSGTGFAAAAGAGGPVPPRPPVPAPRDRLRAVRVPVRALAVARASAACSAAPAAPAGAPRSGR